MVRRHLSDPAPIIAPAVPLALLPDAFALLLLLPDVLQVPLAHDRLVELGQVRVRALDPALCQFVAAVTPLPRDRA